jgi:hypothetical protein
MGEWIFSLTAMVITHITVDGFVLARLAMMLNPCSNVVYIWLRLGNIPRSSLSYMPTPQNSRELVRSSTLAARTQKVDINDRALLKFNIFVSRTLTMFIEKYFIY